jgi:hypothetical protein
LTHSKLLQLLEYEGPEMEALFKKASVQGRGTPQEVAEYRENAFRTFISRYFPFPHRISKGNVVDLSGNESASIDCIIINPAHPYTIDTYDKFTVILADGVDVAIEVKPDISGIPELHRGLKQVESVKRLWRQKSPWGISFTKQMPTHVVEHSKKIPCFLFSNRAKTDPLETAREVCSYYAVNSVPLEHQVDFIIINRIGIISNHKYPEIAVWMDKATETKMTGIYFEYWGSSTIAAFLLYLNRVPHATTAMVEPILIQYLDHIRPARLERVGP